MKTDELREKYLSFYESKGHRRCASDVMVPTWDPSVLFTPAGMNQFKDHFLGRVKLEFTRATTCQKCLRTGDIDNVGRTAYHHTFFEMLGNFSFGDYFKREAINWSWEFLTKKEWLGIDPQRLSVTVYKDDNEAANLWMEDIGLPSSRITRLDEDENFWPASAPSSGPDGVCGPCSEIFYTDDTGAEVEIWNLVFTQFNRVGDPPDNLRPLPSKNIDTGMGLERTAATLQGVATNFHTDALRPIVEAAAEVCGQKYEFEGETGRRLRRITDHVRSCVMAIHENVYPGPNKEKYVIRRLLRRAVLDGHQMGLHDPFLHQLVDVVVEQMAPAYPELRETSERVSGVIRKEEENFFGTIDDGLARIEETFGTMRKAGRVAVDGSEAAELYQTFGVPPELFEAMAAEQNFAFDWDGFGKAMEEHGEASGKQQFDLFKTGPIEALKRVVHTTEFLGYETQEAPVEIKAIIAQNQLCDELTEVSHEDEILIVLDRSPFYGESGGQVGDAGTITGDGFVFKVNDAQKDGDLIVHHGHLTEGSITAGDTATATVDDTRRSGIRRAHSATHVLHHALQKTLGSHAQQQGSKVDEDWLRFDFTNLSPVDIEQLETIQHDVVEWVSAAEPVSWKTLPLAEAREVGAMMLFGEKYPDPVRMVSMGQFSRELCGGTHLNNTSEIENFDILAEEGVAAGTRRITAFTGERARQNIQQTREAIAAAASTLGVAPLDVPGAAKAITAQVRALKKEVSGSGSGVAPKQAKTAATSGEPTYTQIKRALRDTARILATAPTEVVARLSTLVGEVEQLKKQLAAQAAAGTISAESLLEQAQHHDGVKVVACEVPGGNINLMRQLIDQLRKTASPCAVLLASQQGDDKVTVIAGVSRDLVDQGVNAGNWVRDVAKVMGGGGGGKPDMAQAGGRHPEKLPEALDMARESIAKMLRA